MRFAPMLVAAGVRAAVPGPGESRYLYGLHDFSLDDAGPLAQVVLTEGISNAALGLPEDSDNGWFLHASMPLADGAGGCGLCQNLAEDGFAVIVRLQWSYSSGGSIPSPDLFATYAARAAEYADGTPSVHLWVVGNEPNLSVEWPGGDPTTPGEYADCLLAAREAIRAVAGHESDRVLIAAAGPWNVESGDWRDYFAAQLALVGESYDGAAIHAYTHETCRAQDAAMDVSLTTSLETDSMGARWHFRVFEDFMDLVPAAVRDRPVYVTEAGATQSWTNVTDGWFAAAYGVVADWNAAHPDRVIRALLPYRWEPWDNNAATCREFSLRDRALRIADFQAALAEGLTWCGACVDEPPTDAGSPPDAATADGGSGDGTAGDDGGSAATAGTTGGCGCALGSRR